MMRFTILTLAALLALLGVRDVRADLVHQWTFNGTADDLVGSAHGALINGATITGGRLQLDGVNDFMRTATIRTASNAPEVITNKTLVAWVSLDNLTQRSGSALTLENPIGGDVFDGIVYAERTANQWMAGSNGFSRTPVSNGGASETVVNPGEVMIAISYAADNSITLYRNNALYGSAYTQGTLQTYSTQNVADALVGLRHFDIAGGTGTLTGNDQFLGGFVNEVRIYDTALNLSEVQSVFASGPITAANTARALADPLHRWSFNDGTANDSIGTAHGVLNNGASIAGGQLQLDGINDYVRTATIDNSLTAKSLVTWVTLDNLSQRSGGVMTLENPAGGDVFDSIVYGERTAGQWMAGSNFFSRSNGTNNGGVLETSSGEIMMSIVYDVDGSLEIYRDGSLYASYQAGGPVDYLGGVADVLFGLRHEDVAGGSGTATGNDQFLAGLLNEARLYGVALTPEEILTLFQLGPDQLQQPQAVPEPSSLLIWTLAAALAATCLYRKRRSR